MAVILAIHTKTASKLSFIDIIHRVLYIFVYHHYRNTIRRLLCHHNHTTIIGTTKQSQKYVIIRKFDVFDGKYGCDCEDKTNSNCYVLKYSEIVVPDTFNPLKHIGTITNCTTIGTFTLLNLIEIYCSGCSAG